MSDETKNIEEEYPSAIFEEPEEEYDTSKWDDEEDTTTYTDDEEETIDTTGTDDSVQQFRSKMDDIYEDTTKWNDYVEPSGDVVANKVEGDQEIERSQVVGGNQIVRGTQLIEHDLLVKGHIVAGDIYGLEEQIDEQLDEKLETTTVPKAKYADESGQAAEASHAKVADVAVYAQGIADGSDFTDTLVDALKSIFLSRINEDTANALITFIEGLVANKLIRADQGVQFGKSFVDGMTGMGGYIDKNGVGTLDSLTIRRELIVPYLVYNKERILVGNDWAAPGGGVVESVEPDYDDYGNMLTTGTITLKLEDGEPGAIAVDDFCMGIWHNIDGGNATTDSDDSRGNFTYAGFSTVYFRITEVLDDVSMSKFRYALRPISERWKSQHHPAESMTFVSYANPSDETRQACRYETRSYIRFLSGCTGWEFTQANIKAQFGDLSNLKVFGLDMAGYSAYLANLYMTGTFHQVSVLPLRLEFNTNGDNFLAYGETLHVKCSVYQGWEDRTAEVTKWSVTRDTADTAADEVWAQRDKVKNFNGEIDLCLDSDPLVNDLGENDNVISTLFTFTAEITTDDGTSDDVEAILEI